MNYKETLAYLYASQPAFHIVGASAYKPGLDNTHRLMKELGDPHKALACVHIAGTNGKGSTSHLIAAALQCSGLKVGLYTSPHLVDFRERIRILTPGQSTMIPEESVVDFVAQNKQCLEEIKPSFFETTMAMAFDYFVREKVDIAVIEVGLGGRLDSTNIISPLLSVITNIGLDHTEFLGDTIAKIAREKAGIIKPNVPVVVGESDGNGDGNSENESDWVFREKAEACGSAIIFADQQAPHPIQECQLKGVYQAKNIQTAYVALLQLRSILEAKGMIRPTCAWEEAAIYGFAHVCELTGLRGRWEVIDHHPLTIIDTGHNSHGIKYVAQQLQQLQSSQSLHIVFGMVDDKDVDVVLSMMPKEATYYWTQAPTHRAIPAITMQQMGASEGLHGEAYTEVTQAIHAAQTAIRQNGPEAIDKNVLFIGGSNYIIGEALKTWS